MRMSLKKSLLTIMVSSLFILTACSNDKPTEKEEFNYFNNLLVEDIEFKENNGRIGNSLHILLGGSKNADDKVIINTKSETWVVYLSSVKFYKLNDDSNESHVNIKQKIKEERMTKYKSDITGDIYLNEEDAKEISKHYADIYTDNLLFESPTDSE